MTKINKTLQQGRMRVEREGDRQRETDGQKDRNWSLNLFWTGRFGRKMDKNSPSKNNNKKARKKALLPIFKLNGRDDRGDSQSDMLTRRLLAALTLQPVSPF